MWTKLGRLDRPLISLVLCILIIAAILFQKKNVDMSNAGIESGKASHEINSLSVPSESRRLSNSPSTVLEKCAKGKHLVGPLYVNKQQTAWQTLKNEIFGVRIGGAWKPTDCIATVKLALIIPFRNREEHLKIFLRQIHPVLQRQRLSYQIFVIDQVDKSNFNRGKLMNVGFNESRKYGDFNCFVFHDVDLIPENDMNYYGCSISPTHLSVAIDKFNYQLLYGGLFGGVEMFTKNHFEKINGFSNIFWGWGAEDDNLYQRVNANGLGLKRPAIEHARYQMIKHEEAPKDNKRHKVLREGGKYFKDDGINSLVYRIVDRIDHMFYTQIQVDLQEGKDKIIIKNE